MKKHRLNFIIGCFLSIAFLWLALRKVDFATLWQTLRTINYWWTIPFVILTMFSMYARALRWHYLLLPDYRISPRRLFSPTMIGFAFNGIFPARAGEFARAYVVAKKENMSFSGAFATIIVERIFDASTNIFSFAVALLLLPPFDPRISFLWDTRRHISGSTILIILDIFLALCFIALGYTLVLVLTKARPTCTGRSAGLGPASSEPHPPGPPARAGWVRSALFAFVRNVSSVRRARIVSIAVSVALLLDVAALLYLNVAKPIPAASKFSFGRSYLLNGEMLQSLSRRTILFIALLLLMLMLLMIGRTRNALKQFITRLAFLHPTLRHRTGEILDSFARGLSSLQNLKALLFIIFYSFVVWLAIGLSVLVMSYGFPQLHMTLPQAVAIVVIICIAILIPAAPGYWGLYEFGCIFALQVLNITSDNAVALGFSLIIHSLQVFPIIAVGLLYAWREHVSISKLREEKVTR
jgi:uncharacterized membrane protein YbhN (UPF0104 family)